MVPAQLVQSELFANLSCKLRCPISPLQFHSRYSLRRCSFRLALVRPCWRGARAEVLLHPFVWTLGVSFPAVTLDASLPSSAVGALLAW
jgi:hypothetical protein